jgi:hypothetical protein
MALLVVAIIVASPTAEMVSWNAASVISIVWLSE